MAIVKSIYDYFRDGGSVKKAGIVYDDYGLLKSLQYLFLNKWNVTENKTDMVEYIETIMSTYGHNISAFNLLYNIYEKINEKIEYINIICLAKNNFIYMQNMLPYWCSCFSLKEKIKFVFMRKKNLYNKYNGIFYQMLELYCSVSKYRRVLLVLDKKKNIFK